MAPALSSSKKSSRPPRIAWAELLRRVFLFDVLQCACGGRCEVLSFITEPETCRRILVHLGLPADPPPIARARPPPQRSIDFEPCEHDLDSLLDLPPAD